MPSEIFFQEKMMAKIYLLFTILIYSEGETLNRGIVNTTGTKKIHIAIMGFEQPKASLHFVNFYMAMG